VVLEATLHIFVGMRFAGAILLFLHFCCAAQPSRIIFNHFSLADGFTSTEALAVCESRSGLVWIATNDGLAKFDSKRFTFYKHRDQDTNSLRNNYCSAVVEDIKGMIWVIAGNCLEVFNPKTNKFSHVRVLRNGTVSEVGAKELCLGAKGEILYIATTAGLYKSSSGSLALQVEGGASKKNFLAEANIATLTTDNRGKLWTSGFGKIVCLDTRSGEQQQVVVPKVIDGINNSVDYGNFLCSYYDTATDKLYFGTWCNGLIEYDTKLKVFHQYVYRPVHLQMNTIPTIAKSSMVGQENILWCGTYGFSLCAFNLTTHKFTSYKTNIVTDLTGTVGNCYNVHPAQDRLWVGTSAGLYCYNKRQQVFSMISLEGINSGREAGSFSYIGIERTGSGKDEHAWAYVPYVGAYRYNFSTGQLCDMPAKLQPYVNGKVDNLEMYIDKFNCLWVSTTKGLIVYDIAKDIFVVPPNKYFTAAWSWATCFFEDESDDVWIGTFQGLFKYERSVKKIAAVVPVNTFVKNAKVAEAVLSMVADCQGKLCLSLDYSNDKQAAIISYDKVTHKVSSLYKEAPHVAGNNKAELRGIACDHDNKLYAVFFNEHIKVWDLSQRPLSPPTVLDDKRGLNNAFIDHLKSDSSGKIWFTNTFGSGYFDPQAQAFVSLDYAAYGLDVLANPSLTVSPNTNKIYLGYEKRIFVHSNDALVGGNARQNICVNSVSISGKRYPGSLSNGALMSLGSRQNSFTLEFVLQNFLNPSATKYMWFLKGHDAEWVVGSDNMVRYTNLQPGDYTLHLKARDAFGVESEVHTIRVMIAPPMYKRWWFIAGCFALCAALLYFYMQQRINSIKDKYALRNKIAADLHDDIGSAITSINMLSASTSLTIDHLPEKAHEMVNKINIESKQIQQNLSDIVWSIKPENSKAENLVARMREYAAQTLELADITFEIRVEEQFSNRHIKMQGRRDILLIFKEAIANIVKHAHATEVHVRISQVDKSICMVIQDNGKWHGVGTGSGLKSMAQRAKVIGGKLDVIGDVTGTKVVLSVPIT
jgi:ligand-binding sensor domain-containing protein/two-component sensor histidine kinase